MKDGAERNGMSMSIVSFDDWVLFRDDTRGVEWKDCLEACSFDSQESIRAEISAIETLYGLELLLCLPKDMIYPPY